MEVKDYMENYINTKDENILKQFIKDLLERINNERTNNKTTKK
jgi:hypothetical protein